MEELIEIIKNTVKILYKGIIIGWTLIGLVILALSLKQCITVKQNQNVQSTEIQQNTN